MNTIFLTLDKIISKYKKIQKHINTYENHKVFLIILLVSIILSIIIVFFINSELTVLYKIIITIISLVVLGTYMILISYKYYKKKQKNQKKEIINFKLKLSKQQLRNIYKELVLNDIIDKSTTSDIFVDALTKDFVPGEVKKEDAIKYKMLAKHFRCILDILKKYSKYKSELSLKTMIDSGLFWNKVESKNDFKVAKYNSFKKKKCTPSSKGIKAEKIFEEYSK